MCTESYSETLDRFSRVSKMKHNLETLRDKASESKITLLEERKKLEDLEKILGIYVAPTSKTSDTNLFAKRFKSKLKLLNFVNKRVKS